jgi:hypothetical protein
MSSTANDGSDFLLILIFPAIVNFFVHFYLKFDGIIKFLKYSAKYSSSERSEVPSLPPDGTIKKEVTWCALKLTCGIVSYLIFYRGGDFNYLHAWHGSDQG